MAGKQGIGRDFDRGRGEGGERKETIIIKLMVASVSRVKRRNLVANQIVCIILAISS